ncbi:MAG TPA: GntR family transcriptional regulator [Anaerolineaceae bacterium]|jgi:GntR family transcriptional regulator
MPSSRRLHQAQEVEAALHARLGNLGNVAGRLPSETDLADEYGVSRVTIREALSSLERKGLIFRKHGVGTFLNQSARNIQTRLDESIEFGELIRSANYVPELGLLESRVTAADTVLAGRLLIEPGEPVLCIRKSFKASGTPLIYCVNVIPLRHAPPESQAGLAQQVIPQLSIYTILERWFSQHVSFQISSVSACLAGPEIGEILSTAVGSPLLRLEDIGYSDRQQALFSADVYFLPGVIQFQLVRSPIYSVEEIPPRQTGG